jgi:hypothetical protein
MFPLPTCPHTTTRWKRYEPYCTSHQNLKLHLQLECTKQARLLDRHLTLSEIVLNPDLNLLNCMIRPERMQMTMMQFFVRTISFLSLVAYVSCKIDQANLNAQYFPSLPNIDEDYLQVATKNVGQLIRPATSLRPGPLATDALSGYIISTNSLFPDCVRFHIASFTKLNTCITEKPGSFIISATSSTITTSKYSDISCTQKISEAAFPSSETCGKVENEPIYSNNFITKTLKLPYPISYVQFT